MQITKLRESVLNLKDNDMFFKAFIYVDKNNSELALEFIRQYQTYFYKPDLIKLFIACQSDEQVAKVQEVIATTCNTLQDHPEAMLFVIPSIEVHQSEVAKIKRNASYGMTDCTLLLSDDFSSFSWLKLYKAFHEVIHFGNSWYEYGDVSDLYDVCMMLDNRKRGIVQNISTFSSTFDLDCLDYINHGNVRSILDIGCGAGAFYHLLKGNSDKDLNYFGVDLSRNQILTAVRNYGAGLFDLKDINHLTVEHFNNFEFVHCYSVLTFLQPQQQANLLFKILHSSATTFLDIGCTCDKEQFSPQRTFMRSPSTVNEQNVFSPIYLLMLEDVERILAPFNDKYDWEVVEKDEVKGVEVPTSLNEPLLIPKQLEQILESHGKPIINKEYKTYTVRLRPKGFLKSKQDVCSTNQLTEKLLSIASSFEPVGEEI